MIEPKFELLAKEMRAQRDLRYENIFMKMATDERWVGDLGEIVFNLWLKDKGVRDVKWVLESAAGQPDFVLPSGLRIGVKTVKRKGPPKTDYTAQITARHADEPIDAFFFMSYEIDRHRMWLLGGIEKPLFF